MNQPTSAIALLHRFKINGYATRVIAALLICGGVGTARATPADDARIDAILTDQEKASAGLKDIRCAVRFVEDDRMNLTRQIKVGTVTLLIEGRETPQFLVHFQSSQRDGVAGKQEWYLFDGRWLYQAIERLKQVTKQEFAADGEGIDLFDLEKAPFPLPFGQKKDKILNNFNVALIPPAANDPPNTDHLVCTPKPNSRLSNKYDRLEFFVRRDLHLPGRVIAIKKGGLEINTADFPDLSTKSFNRGISGRDLAPPPAWKDYKEVVERLE